MRRLPALALALSLLAPAAGFSQMPGPQSDVVSQVLGLAPQLVAFAGSDANFRNLVQGLSQGTPVTLVTVTPDGLTQTVTFPSPGAMSAIDIARTLEAARQQLIARGVAAPNALQIGTTLVGGALPTPTGTVQVNPVLTQAGALVPQPSASAGASGPRLGAVSSPSSSNLTVSTQPTTTVTTTGGTTTGTTGTTTGTTTGSSAIGTGNTGTPAAPGVVFSGPNPIFTSTPAPATGSPNGAPSPAVQMQGRR